MTWVDWGVLAAYAILMLGIGRYYSLRNVSTEDFFVGGRTMSPILVGISIFATLVSTLSYLGLTGEIIANGPMMLSQMAAYPLIYLITGYALIPLIMRQPVMSAYEILDKKLGTGIRKAGAGAFLLLRMGWMATILYATSSLVLVPMLGISQSWTPVLCVVIGILTVIYSSEGGIRAIVVTDALQSIIMMAGAVITLGVISFRMGGVSRWWPSQWPENWPAPEWGFNPDSRLSFGMVVLSMLVWYICTNGSDQMVIQRYLSTRDASAARRTLASSLFTEILVTILLTLTGLALLGFYLSNPSALPVGETVVSAGDQLFSRFIMQEMPAGLTGVVLAAILSAAMSSLSSGINSACVVLDRDFLSRANAGPASVSQMKRLSWAIGITAIVLSLLSTFIQGNLIERCNKVVNLFTVPIFVLFFLALFIPFANSLGAWCGLAASVAAAVVIAYAPELNLNIGISFIWMMPISLLVGLSVGVVASFLGNQCRFHKSSDMEKTIDPTKTQQ